MSMAVYDAIHIRKKFKDPVFDIMTDACTMGEAYLVATDSNTPLSGKIPAGGMVTHIAAHCIDVLLLECRQN